MKWYWQLYFLLLLVLGYGQMLRKIISDTGGFSSRYAGAIVVTVIVLGLIAKSRELALGKSWMWKTLFVALVISSAAMAMFGLFLGVTGVYLSAAYLCLGAVVLVPAMRELHVYSYRSPDTWDAKTS